MQINPNLVSQHASAKIREDLINYCANPTSDVITGLTEFIRFASEMHHTFGLSIISSLERYRNSYTTRMVTPSGLPAGTVKVDRVNDKWMYFYSSPAISKTKSSRHSDRNTRESSKISSLIRAIKTNSEEPTEKRMTDALMAGINYAFSCTFKGGSIPTLSLRPDLALILLNAQLGIDINTPQLYIDELRSIHEQHMQSVAKFEESQATYQRFKRGATVVGVLRSESPRAYFVGEAHIQDDSKGNREVIHTPLKRYATLAGTELAPTVMMIKTYIDSTGYGMPNDNEFGFPMRDMYYEAVDVGTGFSGSDVLWVTIPKEAP